MLKKTLLGIAIIFIAVQFYRPYKNSNTLDNSKDFLVVEKAPKHIVKIVTKSCYDCHSNDTNYKWYDNIAPLSWYVDSNIKRAKFSLNFSDWGNFPSWRRLLFFQGAIPYDIDTKKMPPQDYLLMHSDAKISRQEKKEINTWISSIDFTKE